MRPIDAEELLIKLQWHCDLNCPYTEQERQKTDICDTCLLGDAKDYIDSMPTLEVKPTPHGHWETDNLIISASRCSVCKKIALHDEVERDFLTPYCPFCGAKMDEVST